ncbi:hypothetical protein [Chromobacterium haemolyticum]|uniref:hypothetical protein n=1 Tax=Chromobacterium haemolyticum TaxID=394935 RepID=UPI0013B42F6C|nr:hypothetical protein [Chromobacterium haemolyticum]
MKYQELWQSYGKNQDEARRYVDFLHEHTISRSFKLADSGQQYELEAVKHLALINSAGIAAVIALYSAQGTQAAPLHNAILCFACGLMLSVIVMVSAAYLLYKSSNLIIERFNSFIRNEIHTDKISESSKKENCWHTINIFIGIASFVLFIFGIYYCWNSIPQ